MEFLPRHQAEFQAANCRAVLNRLMSPTVAAISDAVIEPIPGIVASQRAVSSVRACVTISASKVSDPFTPGRCSSHAVRWIACLACLGMFLSSSTSVISSSSFRYAFWNGDAEFRGQATHGVR